MRLGLALARRSKFSDTARNPAKQRSISSAVLRSLMSVGNATDKAEWRRTYGQIPRRSKFSDTARNPAKQRSISSAVLQSLMSVGNATDKAEWRRTYGQIPRLRSHSDSTSALRAEVSPRTISSLTLAFGLDFGATRRSLAEDNCVSDENSG